MIDEITPLADIRSKIARLKELKKVLEDEWKSDPEYVETLAELKESESIQEKLIEEYKQKYLSLAVVDETGKVLNPNPHPAITLKRFDATKLVYDTKKVFFYCLHNLTTVLDLNTKEFEKQAKTGKLPDDVVEVVEGWETRVQFSTDLSKYETE
jgi:hypothetical protein